MKIKFSLLVLFFLPAILFSQSQNTIAVMELDGLGISETESKIITVRLRTSLINTGKYVVLEREKMEDILLEQGFQLSGCTSNECVVEAGQLLGVKQIIAGSVGKIGNIFTITVRIIDVQSGEIIKTATVDCNCKIETFLTESIKKAAHALTDIKEKVASTKKNTKTVKRNEKTDLGNNGFMSKKSKSHKNSKYIVCLIYGYNNTAIEYSNLHLGTSNTKTIDMKGNLVFSLGFGIEYKHLVVVPTLSLLNYSLFNDNRRPFSDTINNNPKYGFLYGTDILYGIFDWLFLGLNYSYYMPRLERTVYDDNFNAIGHQSADNVSIFSLKVSAQFELFNSFLILIGSDISDTQQQITSGLKYVF